MNCSLSSTTHFLLPSLSDSVFHSFPEVALLYARDNLLPSDQVAQLLEFAVNKKANFVPTSITTNTKRYPNHRNSLVLYEVPEWMCDCLRDLVPEVLKKLSYPPFPISRMEVQLTAHNDNNYYKIHTDNGCGQTERRKLTFVYYFYREPKAFEGGNLIIHNTKMEEKRPVKMGQSQVRKPANNSLVFFLSSYLHEVTPVKCPSRAFENGRFTINGWVS